MQTRKLNTLVIGSGCAGLAAAVRLNALGVSSMAVYTEGLRMGTSINTGSDKQTYYKLGMYGRESDSPALMAEDLMRGGSMHGDIALVEAAMSQRAFANLVNLGVGFPHDEFGQYIGYKTDHDPKRRATSCGPYTSRDMCQCLINELKRRNVEVCEKRVAVKLLTVDSAEGRTCAGAIFVDRTAGADDVFEVVQADNIVFAVGGPGGLYEQSVYPAVHTGAIGLALEAGAKACNLAESQFGLASIKFRWNVSGSYMQVLPRFISCGKNGKDEREFLREYFKTPAEMYDAVFLKGYQWPFSAGHVPGSSLIDIFTYIETVERGRRVFLDYRIDPADFDISALNSETKSYLERSGALSDSPLKRLERLNAPAIELYRGHNIDLASEPLEIAVCAQHNNGGLAGNIWWESINLKRLFPVGEVNGSHGVTRPGGSALNAGQAGAFRASEYIAAKCGSPVVSDDEFMSVAQKELAVLYALYSIPAKLDWKVERSAIQERMSRGGAFIRSSEKVIAALDETYKQLAALVCDGFGGLDRVGVSENLRNRQLCTAQIFYLECILMQIDYIGSRGGSIVLSEKGRQIHPTLDEKWRIAEENTSFRKKVMMCAYGASGYPEISWENCRPLPETDGWFENIWKNYTEGKIYERQ